jgi:hypothetical protein
VLLVHHGGTAAPPDDDGTVFPFERLQRVPDLHRLTFLPTCSSTNPTPDGIPTAKSGSRIATERHRSIGRSSTKQALEVLLAERAGTFYSGGHGDAVEVDVCRNMQALVRRP